MTHPRTVLTFARGSRRIDRSPSFTQLVASAISAAEAMIAGFQGMGEAMGDLVDEILPRLHRAVYEGTVAREFDRLEQTAKARMNRVISAEYNAARLRMRDRFPYLYNGFRPAHAMIRNTDSGQVWIWDDPEGRWREVDHVVGFGFGPAHERG